MASKNYKFVMILSPPLLTQANFRKIWDREKRRPFRPIPALDCLFVAGRIRPSDEKVVPLGYSRIGPEETLDTWQKNVHLLSQCD